jgi:hypothetical protein
MRIVRVLYSASLLMLLALSGCIYYIFVTPVTEANSEAQAARLCEIGNAAVQLNQKFALTALAPQRVDCGCVSAKLRRQYEPADATRLTVITRQLFLNSMRRRLTGQSGNAGEISRSDLSKIQQFFTAIREECAAGPNETAG